MGNLQFFKFLLVFAFLWLFKLAIAQEPPSGFNGFERDALYALKAELNHPFLNHNWIRLMCYMNNTPVWYGIQCLNGRVTGIVLESLGLTGKIKVDALVNLTQLSILSFKNNSISGNMMDFSNTQKLRQIDLSSNKFDGPISDSLVRLDFLESLQLQDNNLTGSIPGFNQSSLRQFNVSNNHLSGPIPDTKVLQSFDNSSFSGNQDLCGPTSSTPCSNNDTSTSKKGGSSHLARLLIVVDVVGLVVILLLLIFYCKKSRKLKEMKKKNSIVDGEVERNVMDEKSIVDEDVEKDEKKIEAKEKGVVEGEENGKLIFLDNEAGFELGDLLKASAEGLGRGNFGSCYKAILGDGRAIVVQRLKDLTPLNSNEFAKQLQVIASQKHPNLLPLLAYFFSKDEKLLLYKFASNGNLHNRIHGGRETKDRIPFRWSSRLSVARGVARALEHLHLNSTSKSSQATVPHGNLKSSNVLLDNNQTVLVTGYGLTSLLVSPIAAQRMVSYKSPEYQSYKRVSKKSDVWSYGCLLLELLTGRVSAHSASEGANCVDLIKWVVRAVREEWTAEIFDVEITVHGSANNGMLRLLQVAMQCCEKLPEKRPDMSEVVKEFENIKVIESSEDDDELSFDPSFTDDSISETLSHIA
ncbi:probable inactive receptor kinase At2g26730 [Cornus florida]|uniref:probable inactive receptor kinase At2g26730 n=1 Tax=Cornus florida TaxID=4283 RepID=UPI00289A007B|nr:probable inactive receptor kinase At2g26730 [Cornus florida]